MNDIVFVYGTLKSNEPNYHWLTNPENGSMEFIGKGATIAKYPLVIASRFNIPFLMDAPGTGHNIEGEMYRVDKTMLAQLDILEDYPKLYNRRQEPIRSENGGDTVHCWTYFLQKYKPDMLKLPFIANYSSLGDHGKQYNSNNDDLSDPEDIDLEEVTQTEEGLQTVLNDLKNQVKE